MPRKPTASFSGFVAASVTLTSWTVPSGRLTVRLTVWPGRERIWVVRWSNVSTGVPFSAVIRSPACRPAASAGLSAESCEIFHAVSRWMPKPPITMTSSTMAMRKCMAEPATATDSRDQ